VEKMKIVRLNFTEDEYSSVYDQAMGDGYASVPEYIRYLLFNERPQTTVDFEELLNDFEKVVILKKENEEFKVRDCFDPNIWEKISLNDRRTLGRMIIHKVEKSDWLPIIPSNKVSGNAQWYKKIKIGREKFNDFK
jgi:hypothetical protein